MLPAKSTYVLVRSPAANAHTHLHVYAYLFCNTHPYFSLSLFFFYICSSPRLRVVAVQAATQIPNAAGAVVAGARRFRIESRCSSGDGGEGSDGGSPPEILSLTAGYR